MDLAFSAYKPLNCFVEFKCNGIATQFASGSQNQRGNQMKKYFFGVVVIVCLLIACTQNHRDDEQPIGVKPTPETPTTPEQPGPITYNLMHTKPTCQIQGKASTFCELVNMTDMESKAGMVATISKQLDVALAHASTAHVYISYLSFSNMPVQKKLCELGQAGVAIEIVLDNGSRGQGDGLLKPECQKGANIKISYLGGLTASPWRLHHNKFLIVDTGIDTQPITINFSSGNLSSFGTSLHLDHWVTLQASRESNVAKSHMCVISGLRAALQKADEVKMYEGGIANAAFDSVVADTYISSREECFKTSNVISTLDPEKALEQDGIAAVYSPNKNNEVYKTVHNEFAKITQLKAGYIYIAIQHFLDRRVANDLLQAARAGVDVRIVMDDDVVRGEAEVVGVKEFLEETLFPEKRIQIRYIQTNSTIRQMMHNKLTILNGQRVFSGAGHYTGAAMSKNWETFYLTANKGLTLQYMKYFDEIWNSSVDKDTAVGSAIVAVPPAPLASEFLSAIGH